MVWPVWQVVQGGVEMLAGEGGEGDSPSEVLSAKGGLAVTPALTLCVLGCLCGLSGVVDGVG